MKKTDSEKKLKKLMSQMEKDFSKLQKVYSSTRKELVSIIDKSKLEKVKKSLKTK
mgnify:CR=1 FL=1|jgi:hypothetical protein